jgi:hypothetical protein
MIEATDSQPPSDLAYRPYTVTIRFRSRADRAVLSPPGSFVSATAVTSSR